MAVSAAETRARVELIARKLSLGYTDGEIMEELKISRTRYYLIKSKVYRIWGDLAQKKTQASIEFEAQLKDRLTRLQTALELRIRQAPAGEPLTEIAEASAVASQIAVTIFKLEFETLRAREERQKLPHVQRQAARYIRDIPVELPKPDSTEEHKQTEGNGARDEQHTATQSNVF